MWLPQLLLGCMSVGDEQLLSNDAIVVAMVGRVRVAAGQLLTLS